MIWSVQERKVLWNFIVNTWFIEYYNIYWILWMHWLFVYYCKTLQLIIRRRRITTPAQWNDLNSCMSFYNHASLLAFSRPIKAKSFCVTLFIIAVLMFFIMDCPTENNIFWIPLKLLRRLEIKTELPLHVFLSKFLLWGWFDCSDLCNTSTSQNYGQITFNI